MTKPRTWTPEDEEILRQLYLGRQPLGRIAKRFDTTKDNIRKKASRMGLKRPRPKDAPKHDMASRLRVLQGKEVRPPTGRRLFSDEELLRFAGRGLRDGDPQTLRRRVEAYVLDPLPPLESMEVMESRGGSSHSTTSNAWPRLHGLDLFCREVVGLELMDHQLAMAYSCLASKRAVCLAGRQCGKDVTQAALALWEGVVQPNARIVVHSALNWAFRALHLKDVDGDPLRYPVPAKEVHHRKPVVSAQGWRELEPLIRARTNPREYACIRVLRDSGLRPSDVVSIRLEELRLHDGAPRIEETTQKAGVPVYSRITRKTAAILAQYLAHYKPRTYLFESEPGKPYWRAWPWWILTQKCGLDGKGDSSRVTPRIFRRTLATRWQGDLKGLLAQGGWKDPKTVQVHYQQHRTSQHDLDYDALMEPEEDSEARRKDHVDDDAAYR